MSVHGSLRRREVGPLGDGDGALGETEEKERENGPSRTVETSATRRGFFECVWSWCSFTTIFSALFVSYLIVAGVSFYQIFNPSAGMPQADPVTGKPFDTWKPLWEQGSEFRCEVYLGLEKVVKNKKDSLFLLWESPELEFGWGENGETFSPEFNLTAHTLPKGFWTALENDRDLYVHFRIMRRNLQSEIWVGTSLVKRLEYVPHRERYYLVKDWPFLGDYVPEERQVVYGHAASKPDGSKEKNQVGYWKPIASVSLVADWTEWPKPATPEIVAQGLRIENGKYRPALYTDQLGMTRENLIQINSTMNRKARSGEEIDHLGRIREDGGVLPLKLYIGPMSLSRWQFNAHMNEALRMQQQLGASTKDTDEIRHTLTETSPALLGVTLVVSLVHVFIDVLAFKSDISFWRSTKSTVGLSVRSVVISLFTQLIVVLYLQDNGASILVLGPAVVGVVIQAWKISRVWALEAKSKNQDTGEYDEKATAVLLYALLPIVIAYSCYSLVYEKHYGFYSWAVSSLASSVYAFGFAMMTPQLFINYKLKSVAHLPWRFLIYRAINTFIDDLFAFIIRMPMMHRAACFRDDIIFVIYMYQRWIYPVDKSRPYQGIEEEGEHETKKKQ